MAKEALIIYAIDVVLALLIAKLKTDNDPLFQDLLSRVKSMVDERRDPTPEDEAALAAFLAAERSKLHS